MAKKIIQMYDKYQSTTKVYPKIIGECLTEDALDKIKSEVETKYEITQVVVEDNEPVGFSIKDTENDIVYNIPVGGGGSQSYQHNIEIYKAGVFDGCVLITNNSNEPINTFAKFKSYLESKNIYNSENRKIIVTGSFCIGNLTYINIDVTILPDTTMRVFSQLVGGTTINQTTIDDTFSFYDTPID